MNVTTNDLRRLAPWLLGAVGFLVIFAVIWVVVEVAVLKEADHGDVIATSYHGPYDQWVPPQNFCTPTYDSKGNQTGQNCTSTPGYFVHHGPEWSVRVQDEEGHEDWLSVSEAVYQSCPEGAYYPGEGQLCSAA